MEKQQIGKDPKDKIKSAFNRLLKRISYHKTANSKKLNHNNSIKLKAQEFDRCRRYSLGCFYRSKFSRTTQISTSHSPTSMDKNPNYFSSKQADNVKNTKIRYLPTNRCNTELIGDLSIIQAKIKQYNSLLTTKSYIFSEKETKTRKNYSRFLKEENRNSQISIEGSQKSHYHPKNNWCSSSFYGSQEDSRKSELQQFQKENLTSKMILFKKNSCYKKKTKFTNNQLQLRIKTEGVNYSLSQNIEPWETDNTNDFF